MRFKRIIFMGTPDYATTIFKEILENNYNIIALFTQPDKSVGRSKELKFPHIKQFTLDNNFNIPIYQPKSLKDVSTIKTIKDLNPDMIIVAA
ncbi:MAG: formyltransferase family protein, partial [Campylobacterota bacterium]|nr:formyltransferase family protein [Campylobacterota bacterium]